MLVTKKKHLLELEDKKLEIKKLEDLVNSLVLSEVDLKSKNRNQEDNIRFLNQKIEASEKNKQYYKQKIECLQEDLLILKESITNYKQMVEQFEIKSINKLMVKSNTTKKKKLKKKLKKIHDEKLIDIIINKIGIENDKA